MSLHYDILDDVFDFSTVSFLVLMLGVIIVIFYNHFLKVSLRIPWFFFKLKENYRYWVSFIGLIPVSYILAAVFPDPVIFLAYVYTTWHLSWLYMTFVKITLDKVLRQWENFTRGSRKGDPVPKWAARTLTIE